jgi:antitoxin ParD1/3/4
MREWLEAQLSALGYHTPSDYIQALIREDQIRKGKEQLEAELIKGLDSGEATPMTEDDWRDLRQRARDRHAQTQQQ